MAKLRKFCLVILLYATLHACFLAYFEGTEIFEQNLEITNGPNNNIQSSTKSIISESRSMSNKLIFGKSNNKEDYTVGATKTNLTLKNAFSTINAEGNGKRKKNTTTTEKETGAKKKPRESVSIKRDFVASNDGKIFIFGATGINSTSESVWDKFNVYGQRHNLETERALVCCLIYDDGHISQLQIAENRNYYTTGYVPLPLFNVVCNNTRHTRTDGRKQPEVPRGISVVYDGDSCNSQSVGFIEPYFPLRQADNTLAITTKISHGNLSPDLLITWMEAYLWLGVDKVITHALSNLSSDARKVLEYYAKKNVLEFHEYYLPALDAVPRSLPIQWRQTWTDAAVPMFDAFARNIGYTYFSVIDWDEFIIPSGNRTLKQLMSDLLAQEDHIAGFDFRTRFFISSSEPEASDLYLKKYVHRLKGPFGFDRKKFIFKPALARLASSHQLVPVSGYTWKHCQREDAFTRHYRGCLPQDNAAKVCLKAPDLDLVRDTEIAEWADNIADNVRQARDAIFHSKKLEVMNRHV